MKLGFKRGQKGFTLVELMVVMAIIAVLAAIVVPAVSGTSEVSADAQVKNDAGTVNSAISDYYGDKVGAEVFTIDSSTILGANVTQRISSRWPENYLQSVYATEFPLDAASGTGNVTAVNIVDTSGTTITTANVSSGWNAINLTTLASNNYIPSEPKSASDLSGNYHNYLWLVKKTEASTSASGAVESRVVEVFKLTKVETAESTGYRTLYYEQIY